MIKFIGNNPVLGCGVKTKGGVNATIQAAIAIHHKLSFKFRILCNQH
jgi:hypothetical protein